MTAPWYNEERVAQKHSVVLAAWNAERAAARAIEQAKTQPVKTTGRRMYAGSSVGRLSADWNALNTSADSEILTSLRLLRARSRELVRDNEYAKNAIRIVQNNVVGTGIGLQATVTNARGKLLDAINTPIEDAWARWIERDTCHVAGLLGMPDLLRMAVGQLVEAGEVLIRKVRQPFGASAVPLGLEVIEADRLMDQWQTARAPNGNAIRMGVEIDTWGRPTAYWLHPTHPGDYQFTSFQPSRFMRVPAEDMVHLYIIDRWPQSRGVPWFHATLKRLHNMGGYEEAEIVAARASASIMGFIESPEVQASDDVVDGQRVRDLSPGTIDHLFPGEKFTGFAPTRPNTAMADFMRYMLRSVASGIGVSYESLSRDYSQSNYSSSRLALLDDRDLWRVLQGFVIRNLLTDIYREWLDAAVLSGAVKVQDYYSNRQKYLSVRFKPRGWQWVDPTKEVTAYKAAVRAGFMTVADVIGQTGGGVDAEDVFKSRRQELDMMADLDLVFDTDPAQTDLKGTAQTVTPPTETEGGEPEPVQEEAEETPADEAAETEDTPKKD